MTKRWPWLTDAFGEEEEFQTALAAYYIALNIFELADMIATDEEERLKERPDLYIPPCFVSLNDRILSRAYSYLTTSPEETAQLWGIYRIPTDKMIELWDRWMQFTEAYAYQLYETPLSSFRLSKNPLPHINLFKDVRF